MSAQPPTGAERSGSDRSPVGDPGQAEKAEQFLALHHGEAPLLLPNPWDAGSAKILASIGFSALATTRAGFAGTLGRLDGGVTRDEVLEHARTICAATDLPVSADLENCFADEPAGVAETITLAIETGLVGGSCEDFSGHDDEIYDAGLAVERVAAAVEAAHRGPVQFVLTARCENYLHGRRDFDDTVARLQAFQAAGADVLYAPGLNDTDEIRRLVDAVERPVNVLALPGTAPVAELGAIGVKRISVGSGFSNVAAGALADAGRELLERGTYDYWSAAITGMSVTHEAFG
ncbi:MAG: isocitrate lyase/PEP mutase family protein [Acidimicrobiia bacterium]